MDGVNFPQVLRQVDLSTDFAERQDDLKDDTDSDLSYGSIEAGDWVNALEEDGNMGVLEWSRG